MLTMLAEMRWTNGRKRITRLGWGRPNGERRWGAALEWAPELELGQRATQLNSLSVDTAGPGMSTVSETNRSQFDDREYRTEVIYSSSGQDKDHGDKKTQ